MLTTKRRTQLYIKPCTHAAAGTLVAASFAVLLALRGDALLVSNPAVFSICSGMVILAVVVTGLNAPSALRYLTSTKMLEELIVEKVVYTSWEQRSTATQLDGYDNEYISHVVFGSDVYFKGYEQPFRLPTRHLVPGARTRRVVLSRGGRVWAYRWLDL